MPRCIVFCTRFFDRFWVKFWSQLGPVGSQKTWFFLKKKNSFLKNRLSKLTSIFDPILDSTLLHVGIQHPPKCFQKSIPRGIKKLINFGIDFYLILAPFWEPSWSHVGHLSRPKTAQEASKTPLRRLQDASKTVQDAHKSAPRSSTTRGRWGTPVWLARGRWGTPA